MVQITKISGELEEFNANKIVGTLKRAGASKEQIELIIDKVKSKLYPKMPTKKILDLVFRELKKSPGVSARYDLKRAIMALGPTGYPFEKYVAELLKHAGYEVKINQLFKGKNITQEVDIVAKKDTIYMVECKYHNRLGKYTNTKEVMYTYARFLDVNTNKKNFDFPWLVTNTKCSHAAINYSKGVNLKITSWQYPKNKNLRHLIENKNLYPITVLRTVKNFTKEKLLRSGITMVKQLVEIDLGQLNKKTKLPVAKLKLIIAEAVHILNP